MNAHTNIVLQQAEPKTHAPEIPWSDWREFSYEDIPGLAGELYKETESRASRSLPKASLAGTIQMLCMAAGRGKLKTHTGGKVNLITYTAAPSAAGKENPQHMIKSLAYNLGWLRSMSNSPRSDKTIVLDFIEEKAEGCMVYVVDEAHQFLRAMSSSKASEYTQAMLTTILSITGSAIYPISSTTARELRKECRDRRKELVRESQRLDKAAGSGTPVEAEQKELDKQAREIERIEKTLDVGLHDVHCNAFLSSTISELGREINTSTIESGLLGRSLFFLCGEERARLNQDAKGYDMISMRGITNKLAGIQNGGRIVTLSDSGRAALAGVLEWVEDDLHRNDATIGALYSRSYQRISSLAALFAAGDDYVIDEGHVRAAFAIDMQSMSDMTSMLRQNEAEGPAEMIEVRIIQALSDKPLGIAASTLKQGATKPKSIAKACQKDPNLYQGVIGGLIERQAIVQDGNRYKLRR